MSTARTVASRACWIRGQLVVLRTTMEMTRSTKFCWYLRFLSVVTKTSKPAASAANISSPFWKRDHPRS